MNTHRDFEELLRLLEENHVEYMIVGGYAVAFHGYPRFTKDIDIFFESSRENVERLRKALSEFGFNEPEMTEDVFLTMGNILSFGVEPIRIDLINEIDGVSFRQARPNVIRGKYGSRAVNFIGMSDLIKNKKSTPRARDKADVEELMKQKDKYAP